MSSSIALVSLVVRDYDEAIQFYCGILGFTLTEDMPMEQGKRWVVVHPQKGSGTGLLLAMAKGEEQTRAVGYQTGGRVFLFLHTDDFDGYYARIRQHGITVVRGPVEEVYGKVLVFKDLYGNLWDLIQPVRDV